MPPLATMGAVRSLGVACNRPIASMKFDFPEPLGPIRTFSGSSSNSSVSGPKESRLVSLIRLMSMFRSPDMGRQGFGPHPSDACGNRT